MCPGKIEVRQGPLLLISGLVLIYIYLLKQGRGTDVDIVENEKYWQKSSLWLEDSKEHKNPHKFDYLVNPEGSICGEQTHKVDLLVLVASALKHSDRRLAIRETWGDKIKLDKINVKILFLLGTTASQDDELESQLNTENENYSDLVREDFLDSYQNLTLKTVAGVKWAAIFCSQTRWVMKTDDDMFVNIPLLMSHLDQKYSKGNKRVITGCIKNGPNGAPQPVNSAGIKFKPVHPPFTAGAGYVVSGNLIELLYRASLAIKIIRVEDAFLTGYCAKAVGDVEKHHDNQFSCGELVARDCDMTNKMTGHKVTPERMKLINKKLENNLCY